MIAALDSSVIVAALRTSEAYHRECFGLLDQPGLHMRPHAISESFSTLTGGRLGERLPADEVARAIERTILPRVSTVNLTSAEHLAAIREAQSRGVRGGAIYDYLHLVAARKIGAERLYTLDVDDFQSFHRPGDPVIVHP